MVVAQDDWVRSLLHAIPRPIWHGGWAIVSVRRTVGCDHLEGNLICDTVMMMMVAAGNLGTVDLVKFRVGGASEVAL